MISYLTLRAAVGFLGVALPFILAIGCRLFGACDGVEPSISEYYGSNMRDVFVGLLFAIGLFLASYRGYERRDRIAGKAASFFAVCTAIFPTTSQIGWVHDAHFVFAAALFLTLSYFSLFLFTETRPGVPPTPQKKKRNRVYVACGVVMLACIALIGTYKRFLMDTAIAEIHPVFYLEAIALFAFGISWMTKGEVILED